MKITVTKKEYNVVKNLGFNMTKELVKAEEVTGISKEDVDTYETHFDNMLENSNAKGKWGKCSIRTDKSIGNNKIIIDINEDCIADIINELYNPIVIATVKCIVNIAKTFSSVFKKCEKTFYKIEKKWFTNNEE